MIKKNFSILFIIIIILFMFRIANANTYVFFCNPWKDRLNKILMENNFSININKEELTIIGGDQLTKFATLIFDHPNFYLFSSPSGSLIRINRNDGQKKVIYLDSSGNRDLYYSSICNN